MNSRVACALVWSAIASGCAAPKPFVTTPLVLTAEQSSVIDDGLRRALKDPGSAQFGARMATRDQESGTIWVCGYVNAKNSYGGYTGMSPFLGSLMEIKKSSGGNMVFEVVSIGGGSSAADVIRGMCSRRGMAV